MKPARDLTPIEDLDQGILNLCARINAATYELLVLSCDLSMTTAREKVRVAFASRRTLWTVGTSYDPMASQCRRVATSR